MTNSHATRLLATIALAFSLAVPHLARGQSSSPKQYSLRADQVLSGTGDRSQIAHNAPYPLHKRYEEFSPDEKERLRSFYVGMLPTDDPPFPQSGMKYIAADISTVVGRLRVEGNVAIVASVDELGNVTAVKLLEYPNMAVARAISFILVNTKFKPAVCSGKPCPAEFPLYTRLTLE